MRGFQRPELLDPELEFTGSCEVPSTGARNGTLGSPERATCVFYSGAVFSAPGLFYFFEAESHAAALAGLVLIAIPLLQPFKY